MNEVDVLIRPSNNAQNAQMMFYLDVQTPEGDLLHSSGENIYGEQEAIRRAWRLSRTWKKMGYKADVVLDGNVIQE